MLFLIFFLVTSFHLHVFFSALFSPFLIFCTHAVSLLALFLSRPPSLFSPFLFFPGHPFQSSSFYELLFPPSFLSALSSLLSHLLQALSLYFSLDPILQSSFPRYFLSPFFSTSISVYSFTMSPVFFHLFLMDMFFLAISLSSLSLSTSIPSSSPLACLSTDLSFFYLLLPLPILGFFSLGLLSSSSSIFPMVSYSAIHTNTIVWCCNSRNEYWDWISAINSFFPCLVLYADNNVWQRHVINSSSSWMCSPQTTLKCQSCLHRNNRETLTSTETYCIVIQACWLNNHQRHFLQSTCSFIFRGPCSVEHTKAIILAEPVLYPSEHWKAIIHITVFHTCEPLCLCLKINNPQN